MPPRSPQFEKSGSSRLEPRAVVGQAIPEFKVHTLMAYDVPGEPLAQKTEYIVPAARLHVFLIDPRWQDTSETICKKGLTTGGAYVTPFDFTGTGTATALTPAPIRAGAEPERCQQLADYIPEAEIRPP